MEKLYKGVKKKDLPRYEDIRSYGYQYDYDPDGYQHIPERFRTYCIVDNFCQRNEVRFIITEKDEATRRLEWKAERLDQEGHVFRRSPVAHTGHGNHNWIREKLSGLKSEVNHNIMCDDELKEYVQLRRKRVNMIRNIFEDWDYPHYNEQRGWKRSKKRKQYM